MLAIIMEVVIDVLPLVALIVALHLRPILKSIRTFNFVPIDIAQPFLWLVIHYNSKQILHYSLLPAVGLVFALLGVIYVIRQYAKSVQVIRIQKMFRALFNQLFIFSALFAVGLIIWRTVQVFFLS